MTSTKDPRPTERNARPHADGRCSRPALSAMSDPRTPVFAAVMNDGEVHRCRPLDYRGWHAADLVVTYDPGTATLVVSKNRWGTHGDRLTLEEAELLVELATGRRRSPTVVVYERFKRDSAPEGGWSDDAASEAYAAYLRDTGLSEVDAAMALRLRREADAATEAGPAHDPEARGPDTQREGR